MRFRSCDDVLDVGFGRRAETTPCVRAVHHTAERVDDVLLDHPDVAQVCTFALPHPRLGEDVAAAVVRTPEGAADEAALRAFAAERLADFKVPRTIVFVDEIPKGATGKIQRIGLARALGLAP